MRSLEYISLAMTLERVPGLVCQIFLTHALILNYEFNFIRLLFLGHYFVSSAWVYAREKYLEKSFVFSKCCMSKGNGFHWIVYLPTNKLKCLLLHHVAWLDGFSPSLEGMSRVV